MPAITWLPWHVRSFERARTGGKPVLLSIVTSWSQPCREMDLTSYADAEVAAIVDEHFVPIRVDADRRPDISERYSLGGWPTTAFLTADGALAGGGTFVSADRMAGVLRQALAAFASRADALAAAAGMAAAGEPVGDATAAPSGQALVEAALGSFDAEYGGFGDAPKFPLIAPVRLALHLYRDHGDERAADIARRSLEGMGWGALHDDGDGGFFRYSDARTWEQPHREKLLDVNAGLIGLYVEAAEILQSDRYADRAHDALRYVQNWLADQVDTGWAASQHDDTDYYDEQARGFDGRRVRPPVDRTLFAAANGAMVSAALAASRVFDDHTLGAFALASLERVLAVCYRPGQGVAHYVEPGARVGGLLDDHLSIADACLDAFDATANIVYQMMAEELARHALRTMWDDAQGLFFDRAPPDSHDAVGLMRRRLLPFVANCTAAAVLQRLAVSSGDRQFTALAETILAAAAPRAAAEGPLAAHYLLARRALGSGDKLSLP
jgi:uncharacterized protein